MGTKFGTNGLSALLRCPPSTIRKDVLPASVYRCEGTEGTEGRKGRERKSVQQSFRLCCISFFSCLVKYIFIQKRKKKQREREREKKASFQSSRRGEPKTIVKNKHGNKTDEINGRRLRISSFGWRALNYDFNIGFQFRDKDRNFCFR